MLHGMEGGPKSTKSVRLGAQDGIELFTPQLPSAGLTYPWPMGSNTQLTAAWFILACTGAVVGRAAWCATSDECGARAGPLLATVAAVVAGGASTTALLGEAQRMITGAFAIALAGAVVLARAAYCATSGGCGATAGAPLAAFAAFTATFTAVKYLLPQAARKVRDDCADVAQAAVEEFQPDVVIASSLGCASACELAKRGVWSGPTVLLAGAQAKMDRRCGGPAKYALPDDVQFASTLLVHSVRDESVPFEDSHAFLEEHGDRWPCELEEVDDNHRLSDTATGEQLGEWVRQAVAMAE